MAGSEAAAARDVGKTLMASIAAEVASRVRRVIWVEFVVIFSLLIGFLFWL
jgi:hypothetical protein